MHRTPLSSLFALLITTVAAAQSAGPALTLAKRTPVAPGEHAQAEKLLREAAEMRAAATRLHHEAIELQTKAAVDNQRAEGDFRKANALEAEAHKLLKDTNLQAAAGLRNHAHDLQRRANLLAVEAQQHRHRAAEVQEGIIDMQKAIGELKGGGPATAEEIKTLEKSIADAKADEAAENANAARIDDEVKRLRADADPLMARANNLDPQGKDSHPGLTPHRSPSKS
jgi:chromosome segregation ATPase